MKKASCLRRVAFLFNANAKSVTPQLKKKLSLIIPEQDIYFSHSFFEAKNHCQKIIDDGYSYLFCGGGDGTVVSTINLILSWQKENVLKKLPKLGILKLGTGNAMARMLNALDPIEDIKAVLSGVKLENHLVSLIETEDGMLTPFAGMGYDGQIISDFSSFKGLVFKSPFRKIFTSVLGFFLVGIFKTLPKEIVKKAINAKILSKSPSYRIARVKSKDEESFVGPNDILFEGRAALICVGTIPSVGYDFTMFPFAKRRPGFMHLRISAVPLGVCLSHIPSIWQGSFRHEELYDFLVKDVEITLSESLPYQFAGDAMGTKNRLSFRVAKEQIAMVSIFRGKSFKAPQNPLLTPLG